jgi:hypothetical protein
MDFMHGPGGNMGRGPGGPGGFHGGGPRGLHGGPRGFGGIFGLGMGRGLFRRRPGMGCLGYVLSSLFIIILFSFFIGMLIT